MPVVKLVFSALRDYRGISALYYVGKHSRIANSWMMDDNDMVSKREEIRKDIDVPSRYTRPDSPVDHMSACESDGLHAPRSSIVSVSGAMYLVSQHHSTSILQVIFFLHNLRRDILRAR